MEGSAVKAADEVLRAAAARRCAALHANRQHPNARCFAFHLHLEQVGRLPDSTVRAMFRAECAGLGPLLKIWRGVKPYLGHYCQHHHPLRVRLVPDHLGVADIRLAFDQRDHRVTGILLPGAAPVGAKCQALRLPLLGMVRKDRHHCARAKPGSVVFVDHRAAGEDHPDFVGIERNGQVLPGDQITADGMAPVHRPPNETLRVVLVEEVILPFVVD